MLTAVVELIWAALVMAAWVGIAFGLAFIGVFVMDLIGERVYGRDNERGKSC